MPLLKYLDLSLSFYYLFSTLPAGLCCSFAFFLACFVNHSIVVVAVSPLPHYLANYTLSVLC